ncbi:MAG TPA: DNA polymerase III subunit delta' [Actinocrinis sp.]|jgi:DNA polymerase-3 subunit delta'|uniref:DNA polymerase III subunit delta' n=1 Tax=Actinocrinis sp. TaxID=1920516 RepID=UPI002DDCC31A|nr:DNA polymerase III subunit delta' [Actinocrinis sp.]HEV3172233.1 DNA polymerase III subunit delta' [Actinocrinis sp.]
MTEPRDVDSTGVDSTAVDPNGVYPDSVDPNRAPPHAAGSVGGIWSELIGQDRAVALLHAAALAARAVLAGREGAAVSAMTHAWLFTGPPGSGRSTAARAFAAALQCEDDHTPGCGQCQDCHTAFAGTHPDVTLVTTDQLTIGVDQTRGLILGSAMSPSRRRWQVIVIEDADRLTEGAANVLLKAIEEPAPRTVWMLCAPSTQDMLPTILSRCRHLALRTPSPDAIADALSARENVSREQAYAAGQAAQGHIGRARALLLDPAAVAARDEALRLPAEVADIGRALRAAQGLVDAAAAEAKAVSEALDAKETDELKVALGYGQGKGSGSARGVSGSAGILKDLETRQKRRATRTQRDALDRALVDIAAFYRDVLALQLDPAGSAAIRPVHADRAQQAHSLAASSTPEATLRRIEAVLEAREAIAANVAPLLAVESMALTLRAA